MKICLDSLGPTLLDFLANRPTPTRSLHLGSFHCGNSASSASAALHRRAAAGRASQLVQSGRYPILLQNGPDSGLTCA
jgi:hypothetical protein